MAVLRIGAPLNPYRGTDDCWWWDDQNSKPYGPYESENSALLALLFHITEQHKWKERVDTRKKNKNSG